MTGVILFDPGDSTPVEIDWSDSLGTATLVAVLHTLPAPLVMRGELNTATSSFVGIAGAEHGKTYLVEAQAELSLNNPDGTHQILNRQFALRGWNS